MNQSQIKKEILNRLSTTDEKELFYYAKGEDRKQGLVCDILGLRMAKTEKGYNQIAIAENPLLGAGQDSRFLQEDYRVIGT